MTTNFQTKCILFAIFVLTIIAISGGSFERALSEGAVQAKDKQSNMKAYTHKQRKVRRRVINWPGGCVERAGEGDEFFFADACAKAIRAIKGWPDGCDYDYSRDLYLDLTPGIKFYPLSTGKYLGELLCSTGAYNIKNIYLFYDETRMPPRAEVLEFPTYEFPDNDPYDLGLPVRDKPKKIMTKIVGGRQFNSKTKELIVFVKYRGQGDCGEFAGYIFPEGKPALKEFRAKLKCDGRLAYAVIDSASSGPRGWKRYYPR